ncbi:MAG: hypothetical protein J5746_14330 [Victivallales bacterium]|nr:hypothetical protein [Victivallales bacterium]
MQTETKHRMTRRLADWDYSQRAIYMITVTLEDRRHEWLGHLNLAENGEAQNGSVPPHSSNLAENGEAQNSPVPPHSCGGGSVPPHSCGGKWTISPTPYGKAVLEALEEMPRLYPQVKIIEKQLMPEHFHFIVFVEASLPKPLGALIRGFKAGAAKRWREIPPQKCGGTGQFCASPFSARLEECGGPKWADGFQDTVLLHEGQLAAMIAYIRANPARLAEKRANPYLFSRVAMLSLPLDNGQFIGQFEALGNRHLLSRPMHQVQCSRRYLAWSRISKTGGGLKVAKDANGDPIIASSTHEYEERLDDAIAAANHGAVVISPCISDGERQIALEIHKRKLPLVALRNMGFAKMEKPAGRLFDACAEGRLLLLAPAAWPYTTQEKTMSRTDAAILNQICLWLTLAENGEAQNTLAENGGGPVPPHSCGGIKYLGKVPANIDQLAKEAVLATAPLQPHPGP